MNHVPIRSASSSKSETSCVASKSVVFNARPIRTSRCTIAWPWREIKNAFASSSSTTLWRVRSWETSRSTYAATSVSVATETRSARVYVSRLAPGSGSDKPGVRIVVTDPAARTTSPPAPVSANPKRARPKSQTTSSASPASRADSLSLTHSARTTESVLRSP